MTALANLPEAFDERNIRERLLIAFATVAVIWGLADIFAFTPGARESKALSEELHQATNKLAAITDPAKVRARLEAQGAANDALKKLKQLESKLAGAQGTFDSRFSGFIAAKELPRMLETVIEETTNVSMVSIALHEPELLTLGPAARAGIPRPPAEMAPDAAQIFRHTVTLTVRGGFFDILRYFQALSALPWHFSWRELTYEVDAHPVAMATLQVQTLSRDRGPFGE